MAGVSKDCLPRTEVCLKARAAACTAVIALGFASIGLVSDALGTEPEPPPRETEVSKESEPKPCLPIAQREFPPLVQKFQAATEETVKTQDLVHFKDIVELVSPMHNMLEWFLRRKAFGGSGGGEIVVLGLPIIMADELASMHPIRCRLKPERTFMEIALGREGLARTDGPIEDSPVIVLKLKDGRYWIHGVNKVLFDHINKRFSQQLH